jgi:acetyltransferase
LEAYKIPTLKTLVAKTREEATSLSGELGFPLVMKALSPQFTHKTEIDGVVLSICFPSEVAVCFDELAGKVRKSSVMAEFQGVALQRMIRQKTFEVLVGAKRDAQFGSIILFGAGGTLVEVLKDTSIGFPPLNQILARRLMENTNIYQHALSAKHPPNTSALEEILVRFSQLIMDFPEISEADINPIMVDEKNALAVDARIIVDTHRMMREVAEHHDHLAVAPYPKEYIASRKLKNDTEVIFRPIKPEDEERFNELFKTLSEETKRFRFFEIIKELSHYTLTRYCNIDYDREIAIVAELQGADRKIIGAVRLILDPDGNSGEFAVLVSDQWQRFGLGSKLMDFLVDVAKGMRVKKIYGYVIAYNYKMLQLCKKKGFEVEMWDEETTKTSLYLI